MIYNVDARHGLALLPDGSIDGIVSDVPYKTISGGNAVGKNGLGAYGRPTGMLAANNGKGGLEHNDIEPEEYAAEFYRVLKSPGHAWIFINEHRRRRLEDAMLAAGFKTHFLAAWIKNNVTPNRFGMKNGELYFLFRKGPARTLYNRSMKQFQMCNNPVGKKRHPNEKPVELVRSMVVASSQPGETILDPFCGAGGVGVACQETGREFIGFEIDPVHHAVAVSRMATDREGVFG